jgi:hypothetical protein
MSQVYKLQLSVPSLEDEFYSQYTIFYDTITRVSDNDDIKNCENALLDTLIKFDKSDVEYLKDVGLCPATYLKCSQNTIDECFFDSNNVIEISAKQIFNLKSPVLLDAGIDSSVIKRSNNLKKHLANSKKYYMKDKDGNLLNNEEQLRLLNNGEDVNVFDEEGNLVPKPEVESFENLIYVKKENSGYYTNVPKDLVK